MVGLGGLEPPTSPLSGARSSHLSYRPMRENNLEILAGAAHHTQLYPSNDRALPPKASPTIKLLLTTHYFVISFSCLQPRLGHYPKSLRIRVSRIGIGFSLRPNRYASSNHLLNKKRS